jgi:hypothetical protein
VAVQRREPAKITDQDLGKVSGGSPDPKDFATTEEYIAALNKYNDENAMYLHALQTLVPGGTAPLG